MLKKSRTSALIFLLALWSSAANTASAQSDVAAHYSGKSIDFLISTGAGATYDAYARALGRVMQRYMPGQPNFIPKQMEGAGGITAANYIYNIAPKNGLVIAMVNNPVPFLPLLGESNAKYDSLKANWIGSAAAETALLIATRESGALTIEDAISKGITVATTGAGSGSYFNAKLMNRFVGTKLKLISGYQASSHSLLAMERGEVDGFPGIMLSTLAFAKPDWLATKRISVLLQLALVRHPSLPDVPTILERTVKPTDRAAVTFALAPLIAARPIMAPPGVPDEYIKALQDAFASAIKDPDLLAELEKARIDTYGWMTGAELTAFIHQMYATDKTDVKAVAEMLK